MKEVDVYDDREKNWLVEQINSWIFRYMRLKTKYEKLLEQNIELKIEKSNGYEPPPKKTESGLQ
jgi:hypothetical protein